LVKKLRTTFAQLKLKVQRKWSYFDYRLMGATFKIIAGFFAIAAAVWFLLVFPTLSFVAINDLLVLLVKIQAVIISVLTVIIIFAISKISERVRELQTKRLRYIEVLMGSSSLDPMEWTIEKARRESYEALRKGIFLRLDKKFPEKFFISGKSNDELFEPSTIRCALGQLRLNEEECLKLNRTLNMLTWI